MCIKWTIRIREGAVRKARADTSPDIKQNRNRTEFFHFSGVRVWIWVLEKGVVRSDRSETGNSAQYWLKISTYLEFYKAVFTNHPNFPKLSGDKEIKRKTSKA